MWMSRVIRHTAITGLLGSKRFIVSVCAAIAMVLGAMSVGASLFTPGSHTDGRLQSANSAVFTERKTSGKGSSTTDATKVSSALFTQQHTLQPQGIEGPTATTSPDIATPKAKGSVSIEFGPVKTDVGLGVVLGQLQVKVDTPVTGPVEAVTSPVPDTLPVDILPNPGTIDTGTTPATPPPAENPQTPSGMSVQNVESLLSDPSGN